VNSSGKSASGTSFSAFGSHLGLLGINSDRAIVINVNFSIAAPPPWIISEVKCGER